MPILKLGALGGGVMEKTPALVGLDLTTTSVVDLPVSPVSSPTHTPMADILKIMLTQSHIIIIIITMHHHATCDHPTSQPLSLERETMYRLIIAQSSPDPKLHNITKIHHYGDTIISRLECPQLPIYHYRDIISSSLIFTFSSSCDHPTGGRNLMSHTQSQHQGTLELVNVIIVLNIDFFQAQGHLSS